MENKENKILYSGELTWISDSTVCGSNTIDSKNVEHQTNYFGFKPLNEVLNEYREKILTLEGDKINLQLEMNLLKLKLDELYYRRGVDY